MKKLVVTLLKVAISVGIIAWMVWDSTKVKGDVNVFDRLVHEQKNWWALAGALSLCLVATLTTFVRWWYLVRALEIPCRFGAAIRISFWGFLFNLAPLGIVGGDLVKAVMLAHEHPGMRARAVASVVVDRVIGLYLLFVIASTAILLTGFWQINVPEIHGICIATFAITVVGGLGIAVMLTPGITDGRGSRALGRIPRVGHTIESLLDAVRMYRRKPAVLVISSAMCIVVHGSFAVGCYLIARGLPGDVLSLSKHFVIMPLSAAMGTIPLPMGPFEFVLEFLYTHVPEGVVIVSGQGLLVALAYRLITLIIAAIGVCYYFSNRRELAEVIHEAEEAEPAEEAPAAEVIA